MANHAFPRQGNSAANALATLGRAGGKIARLALRRAIRWTKSRAEFDQNVIDRLIHAGLIRASADLVEITPAGTAFLEPKPVEETEDQRQLAGARYAPPPRPLDLGRYRPPHVRRPGSMDYRNYPSMMGGERVPFKTAATSSEA